jgi:hypothetical protein
MKRFACLSAGLLLAIAPALSAQTPPPKDHDNVPERQARENGVRACLALINAMSDYTLEDAAHASSAVWSKDQPNRHAFVATAIRRYSDGDTHIDLVAQPNLDGKCDGTWTETYAVEKTCTVVREEWFKAFTFRETLAETTAWLNSENGNVDVFLTQAGSNGRQCLVKRREVVFNYSGGTPSTSAPRPLKGG